MPQADADTIISRIITCHHISIRASNRPKLERFFRVLFALFGRVARGTANLRGQQKGAGLAWKTQWQGAAGSGAASLSIMHIRGGCGLPGVRDPVCMIPSPFHDAPSPQPWVRAGGMHVGPIAGHTGTATGYENERECTP